MIMAGTKLGGINAAKTNKLKYGEDFYRSIGKIGGTKSRGYAFAHGKFDPRVAGAKGGKISKPKSVDKLKLVEDKNKWYSKLKLKLSK